MAGEGYTYSVVVSDNFHHMDEGESYKLGEFATCEEAVSACKRVVDGFLNGYVGQGKTIAQLWELYTTFGDDAFIVTSDSGCRFSGWEYARQRCADLLEGQGSD